MIPYWLYSSLFGMWSKVLVDTELILDIMIRTLTIYSQYVLMHFVTQLSTCDRRHSTVTHSHTFLGNLPHFPRLSCILSGVRTLNITFRRIPLYILTWSRKTLPQMCMFPHIPSDTSWNWIHFVTQDSTLRVTISRHTLNVLPTKQWNMRGVWDTPT